MYDTSCTSRKQRSDQMLGWDAVLVDNGQVAFITGTAQEADDLNWRRHPPRSFLHRFVTEASRD